MRDHVKVLGILNIVFGVLGMLVGMFFLIFFGGIGAFATAANVNDPDAAMALPILGAIGSGIFLLIALFSAPGIITGWGLLHLKSWARVLTIVLSALNLINVPVGTVLGVYGLWVCLNDETARLFQAAQGNPNAHV